MRLLTTRQLYDILWADVFGTACRVARAVKPDESSLTKEKGGDDDYAL